MLLSHPQICSLEHQLAGDLQCWYLSAQINGAIFIECTNEHCGHWNGEQMWTITWNMHGTSSGMLKLSSVKASLLVLWRRARLAGQNITPLGCEGFALQRSHIESFRRTSTTYRKRSRLGAAWAPTLAPPSHLSTLACIHKMSLPKRPCCWSCTVSTMYVYSIHNKNAFI